MTQKTKEQSSQPWKVMDDFKDLYKALLKRKEHSGSSDSAINVLKSWVNDLGEQNEALLNAVTLLEKQGFHRIDLLRYMLQRRTNASQIKHIENKNDANKNIEYFKKLNCEQSEIIKYLQNKQAELECELKACLKVIEPPHKQDVFSLKNQLESSIKENQILEKENEGMREKLKSIQSQICTLKKGGKSSISLSPNNANKSSNENSSNSKGVATRGNSSIKNVFHLKMLEDLKKEILAFNKEIKKTEDWKRFVERKVALHKEAALLDQKRSKDNKGLLMESNKHISPKKPHFKLKSMNLEIKNKDKKLKAKKTRKTNRSKISTSKLIKHIDFLEDSVGKHHKEICQTRLEIEKLQMFVMRLDQFIHQQERRAKELPEIANRLNFKSQMLGEKISQTIGVKQQLEADISNFHNEIKKIEEVEETIADIDSLRLEDSFFVCEEDISTMDRNELVFLLSEKEDFLSRLTYYINRVPQIAKEIDVQKLSIEQALLDEQRIHDLFVASDQQLGALLNRAKKQENNYSYTPDCCLLEDLH